MQSQNGYVVLETNRTTGPLPRLRKWIIPGAKARHAFLRDGSAGFLLAHFAAWWHDNIEPIDRGVFDLWGWAVRPVRGQSNGYSNHASATAIDIHATAHPRGVPTRKTLSQTQVDKIHAQLKVYGGTLRWGGDYANVPDAMHAEINQPLPAVEKKARELWDSPYGKRVLEANPGAASVIWDGKVPTDETPKPAPKPAPKPIAKSERLAIDYSYARPNPAAVKAAGFRGVVRYVSDGSKPTKELTAAEAKALHDAGLWIALVWESKANRAGEGEAAGVADVKAAEAAADALGYPKSAVIFYAVDYDASPAQVAAYFRGVNSANKHPVGVYGSYYIVEAELARWKWQTLAWSQGKVSKKANWLQRTTHSKTIKGSAASDWDENLLIGGGVPVWNPGEVAVEPKPPVVEPVPPVVVEPAPEPDPAVALAVTVTYANVKSLPKMPQPDVESDVAAVMSQPGDDAQIVLGAEIAPPRYKDAWVLGATAKNLATYCETGECPVSLSLAHWQVTGSNVRKVLGGVLSITPWRPLSIVRADSLLRPDVKVAAMATHFPNGAWSNKFPLTKALRQALWNKQWARVQERVAAHVADGYTVLIGFDANRIKLPELHPAQQVLISDGIDHLIGVPAAGRTITVDTRSSADLKSDHPAITATATIA